MTIEWKWIEKKKRKAKTKYSTKSLRYHFTASDLGRNDKDESNDDEGIE